MNRHVNPPNDAGEFGSALVPYGWDDAWAAAFAPYAAEGLVPGRVVRVDRGRCDVLTPGGIVRADTSFVTPPDPVRVICTGDWAVVEPDGDPRFVRTYLPRRTAFLRSTSSKRSEGQILAANVDHALIAVSPAGDLDLGRIERFTALAWESGAQPVLVLTKMDLLPDVAVREHQVQDVEMSAPGVQVLPVSAATGEAVDVLAAVAAGGTSVLLGQSGAGKSTLANALLGEDTMEVGPVREVDGKGRHTTTTRNLLVLPGGGVLIDTPGLRGVGLWDAGGGVGQVFSEIEELADSCRFHDCAHTAEPGCAVLAAVADGTPGAPPPGLVPQAAAGERADRREDRRAGARGAAQAVETARGAGTGRERGEADGSPLRRAVAVEPRTSARGVPGEAHDRNADGRQEAVKGRREEHVRQAEQVCAKAARRAANSSPCSRRMGRWRLGWWRVPAARLVAREDRAQEAARAVSWSATEAGQGLAPARQGAPRSPCGALRRVGSSPLRSRSRPQAGGA